MFEPFEPFEEEPVKIIISANQKVDLQSNACFVPLSDLSESRVHAEKADLLLVHGAQPQVSESIKAWGDSVGCVVASLDNALTDGALALRVMSNIKGKLDAHEMPANIDIADIRNLAEDSNKLLGFDSFDHLYAFLDSVNTDDIRGILFLLHGHVTERLYRETGTKIREYMPDNAILYLSAFSKGQGNCTALVGIKIDAGL